MLRISMHKGSCLCGAVHFEVPNELTPPTACHCSQCRKQTGHYLVSTEVPRAAVTIRGKEHLKWYQASPKARRGFCSICGSVLFWDPTDHHKHAWTGVLMGAFEQPTNTKLACHIYIEDKGDYYEITDGLPQKGRTP